MVREGIDREKRTRNDEDVCIPNFRSVVFFAHLAAQDTPTSLSLCNTHELMDH